MVPEMTANIVTPLTIIIVLFAMDWRMALGAVATIPLGFLVTMGQLIGYKEKSARFFKANADMNDAIVEYVNGIEVIKAFNQSASSFSKFTNACKYYRDTTLDWWRGCWHDKHSFTGWGCTQPQLFGSVIKMSFLIFATLGR